MVSICELLDSTWFSLFIWPGVHAQVSAAALQLLAVLLIQTPIPHPTHPRVKLVGSEKQLMASYGQFDFSVCIYIYT